MDKVADQVESRATPAEFRYVWPLIPNLTCEQEIKVERPLARQTETIVRLCETERNETVTVPAGTFETIKVVCRNKGTGNMISETWYAPAVKSWVRERRWFSYGVEEREVVVFKVK